jgi:hypothetical protein
MVLAPVDPTLIKYRTIIYCFYGFKNVLKAMEMCGRNILRVKIKLVVKVA